LRAIDANPDAADSWSTWSACSVSGVQQRRQTCSSCIAGYRRQDRFCDPEQPCAFTLLQLFCCSLYTAIIVSPCFLILYPVTFCAALFVSVIVKSTEPMWGGYLSTMSRLI